MISVAALPTVPIITLRVLQRKELTVGQWLLRYCVHLNLLLLFLILLLLAILSFACLRSREQRHEELLPPKNPKGRSVYTVVNNKGQVEKLGGTDRYCCINNTS
jgi:hypothetical protein